METIRWGRCFKALFGIQFEPAIFLNLRSLMTLWTSSGLVRFASRGQEVRFQRHVNPLNNCREQSIGHLLKLRLRFSEIMSDRISPGLPKGFEVGTVSIFVHHLQQLVFGMMDSSFARHWSFLQLPSPRLTDLCRRLNSVLRAGFNRLRSGCCRYITY